MKAKRAFVILISLVALGAAAFGVRGASRSPYFWVKSVEVRELPSDAPVPPEMLVKLADVPLDQASLFSVNLKDVARRVQAHPWVKEVRVEKKLPSTLALEVEFRKPVALLLTSRGAMKYVDAQGRIFSELNLKQDHDLPLISGIGAEEGDKILTSLRWIERWNAQSRSIGARLSTVHWDRERGLRLTVSYPLSRDGSRSRASVELGDWSEEDWVGRLDRLLQVINYLSINSINTRQISADSGKKVVVSIPQGS